ncbi:MAG TPA: hypothetical protein VGK73_34910 [Polyangiaceae bacterium]
MRRFSLLALVKDALVALGLSDLFGLVEYCESCGRRARLHWWSHPRLWTEITGHPDGGCLCVGCFDRACRDQGVRVRWTPIVQQRRDARGRWSDVPPPDPELYPVAARLHAERRAAS